MALNVTLHWKDAGLVANSQFSPAEPMIGQLINLSVERVCAPLTNEIEPGYDEFLTGVVVGYFRFSFGQIIIIIALCTRPSCSQSML